MVDGNAYRECQDSECAPPAWQEWTSYGPGTKNAGEWRRGRLSGVEAAPDSRRWRRHLQSVPDKPLIG